MHKTSCFESLTLHGCPKLIFPMQGLPSNLSSSTTKNHEELFPYGGGPYNYWPLLPLSKSQVPGQFWTGDHIAHISSFVIDEQVLQ